MIDGGGIIKALQAQDRSGRDILRVLHAAQALNPGSDKAIEWMRTAPIARFGYRTAMAMIREGRADEVVRYLEGENPAEACA